MRKVGQILKEVRQQKNLSIQDIAFALKISARTLLALENSEEKELPAKAFVRGFAKSYARYLKIENDEFTSALSTEFGENEPRRTPFAPEKTSLEETVGSGSYEKPSHAKKIENSDVEDELSQLNHEGSRRSFVYLGLGIILVILIGISKKIIDRYQREIVTSTAETTKALTENTPVPMPTSPMSGENSSTAPTPVRDVNPAETASGSASINPVAANNVTSSEAPHSAAGSPLPATPSSSPSTTPTVVVATPASAAKPPEKPTAQATTQSTAATLAPPTSSAPIKAAGEEANYKLKNVEVIVEALGSVEVEYSSKSFPAGKIRLNKGQLHIFKSKNGLKLSFNNGGLARLAVNGKDVGNPGQLGKPTVVIY